MNEKCDLDHIYIAEECCLLEMKTLKEFKSKLKMLLQIALTQFSSNFWHMNTRIVLGNGEWMRKFPRYVHRLEHIYGIVDGLWTTHYKSNEYKLVFFNIYVIKYKILINNTCFKVVKQDLFIIHLLSSVYSDVFIMVKS